MNPAISGATATIDTPGHGVAFEEWMPAANVFDAIARTQQLWGTRTAACVSDAGLSWEGFQSARAAGTAAALLERNAGESIGKGVFGSPFFIVDGEPFFGLKKLPVLDFK